MKLRKITNYFTLICAVVIVSGLVFAKANAEEAPVVPAPAPTAPTDAAVAAAPAAPEVAAPAFEETPEGAIKMAEKANEYYKANGKDAAIKAYNSDPSFKYKSLYVFLLDSKTGLVIAHGGSASMIDQDLTKLRDPSGKLFGKEMIEIKDKGWVEYYWKNPSTNSMQKKRTYIINTGDSTSIGVGVYVAD